MKQQIILKYYHPGYQIALNNWNQVWLLAGAQPLRLQPEYYRGALVYRLPGSSRRIAYKKLKPALLKKQTIIEEDLFTMPF